MKFPRVVRLDATDARVFERAAEPGEWAVPGAFEFQGLAAGALQGKRAQAFRNGFLGTRTFGRATLVEIASITDAELGEVIGSLARHLVERYGAPEVARALPAAREEAEFARTICEHPVHTLLMVERSWSEEGIREQFRVVRPPDAGDHAKVKLWGPSE